MALFKKQVKEEKQQNVLEKYGITHLTDPRDIESVNKIASQMAGMDLMDAGLKLNLAAKPEQKLQVSYQRVLIEQNFILMRQLDRIEKLLKK